jgi:hypothetical protein
MDMMAADGAVTHVIRCSMLFKIFFTANVALPCMALIT